MFGLGWPELVIILIVVLVIFGPKRLPELGQSLGKAIRAIRKGSEGGDEEEPGPAGEEKKKPPADEEE